jgi:hypothetical protein
MPVQGRKTCLFLLLILILSHAALTFHASSHVAAEQQGCQICAQYSNLANAIPPAAATFLLSAGYAPEAAPEIPRLRAAALTPYQQRAPPQDA